jgi:hypothetical protein
VVDALDLHRKSSCGVIAALPVLYRAAGAVRSERGLSPRNLLGEVSEGAV